MIKSMRRKLGFDKIPPFMPLISTKDIELFQTGNSISFQNRKYSKDQIYKRG